MDTSSGTVCFKVNGTPYSVPTTCTDLLLVDFLRSGLHLTGTKTMCREGGCGACTVHVEYSDPSGAGEKLKRSINACLIPVLSCDEYEITTIEGIGNQQSPHELQKSLTEHYGTQCGYCTPGMVMGMYSLLEAHNGVPLTKEEIEGALDGNLCRCTGYRPILDAFKTFGGELTDVENCHQVRCQKTGKLCLGNCHKMQDRTLFPANAKDIKPWHRPKNLSQLYQLAESLNGKRVYYVVGHTGTGVYKDDQYDAYVDLKGVPELFKVSEESNKLTVGAGVSLTDLITFLNSASKRPGFHHLEGSPTGTHLERVAQMIQKTASSPVRNAGSWGGNLAMKHKHPEFPSDSFTAFEAAGATITLGPSLTECSLTQFLKTSLENQIILQLNLPAVSESHVYRAYKIMPRYQNAHAYVNAAFLARLTTFPTGPVVIHERPRLVFGNIASDFIHALETEEFLEGKDIADPSIAQNALKILHSEIHPATDLTEADPHYKRNLAVGLFYKFILELLGPLADPRFASAVGELERPLSSGQQTFETNPDNWPVNQPIPKIESMIQCTGEAKYTADYENDRALHCAFVLTDVGNADIVSLDFEAAQSISGVVRVITADDIPGKNIFNPYGFAPEIFLAKDQSDYAGQPVAIVIAESQIISERAAKVVAIRYGNRREVITTAREAAAKDSFHRTADVASRGEPDVAFSAAKHHIEGEFELGGQTHFHMETMAAVAIPHEDGLSVEASTQCPDADQNVISEVTGIGKHGVNVTVKRLGGGFGAKALRCQFVSAAASLSAILTKQPVKMQLSLEDQSKMIGKRVPYLIKYKVGFDNDGKVAAAFFEFYGNVGASDGLSFFFNPEIKSHINNVYNLEHFSLLINTCKSHIAPNTACRSPGTLEAVYAIEHVMEHIAATLDKSPLEVRMHNLARDGDPMGDGRLFGDFHLQPLIDQLLSSSEFEKRQKELSSFNQNNRWRKKGISVVPARFTAEWSFRAHDCLISIFHTDGTVAVTHAGIEMGQGINTKVVQVVAKELGIDMKYIKVHPTMTLTSPNTFPTAGSSTSELVCQAAIDCCTELKSRMFPSGLRDEKLTCPDHVEASYRNGIDLCARGWVRKMVEGPHPIYNTYGAGVTEVEIDVLTGQYQINRCDVLYDCGESLSPLVDIGQIEGALIMGFGYFTSEELIYDPNTGENLTTTTWKYKPPTAKDIPVDLRVSLLKSSNPRGVLRSKLVGEPPMLMTSSVAFALRNAIQAYHSDFPERMKWFKFDCPLTPARVQGYCRTDISQYITGTTLRN